MTPHKTLKEWAKSSAPKKKPPKKKPPAGSEDGARAARSERPDRSCTPAPPGEGRLRDYVWAALIEVRLGLRVCRADDRPEALAQIPRLERALGALTEDDHGQG